MGFYRKPLEEIVPSYVEIIHRAPDLYHTTATESTGSSVSVRQQNGQLTYVPTEQFALTSSNHFRGNQIIDGNLDVNGTINVSNLISASIIYESGSTIFGNSMDDYHQFTGSIYITGSTNQIGNSTIIGGTTMSGSLDVSGSTTFKGTHILSGSNTILGNTIMSGSVSITGSTTQIGNNTLIGNTILSGTFDVSGSTNFHNHTITMTGSIFTSGSQVITGSLDIKGNVNIASGSEFYLAGNKMFNYGDFCDTTIQSGSANTAYAMKLNTTNFSHNINVVSGSRITPQNTGIYNIQFSAQLSNTANTNISFDVWLDYTGSNVANSNTQIDVNKSAGQLGRAVAAWNFLKDIKAGDYVEIMWSCNASTGQLLSTGSMSNPTRPAIPSVICTITQVG